MATKLENNGLEAAHFKQFSPYLKDSPFLNESTINFLLAKGCLQVSTLFEYAVADTIGCEVVSQDSNDLSNGGDAKLSSVRTSSYGTSYSAPVTGIYNKIGTLYVQVFERKQHKFYYFAIPHESYCRVPKSSNIEIPFESDGTPRRRNNSAINWWKFEQPGFIEMCAIPGGWEDDFEDYDANEELIQQQYQKTIERNKRSAVISDLFY